MKIQKPKSPKEFEQTEQLLDINPNFDIDKPNKLVFAYHEPSKDLAPAHTPEKIRNPEKWKFYDFDLDAVREEIAKDIFLAGNLSKGEFKEREEFIDLLLEHKNRQVKIPPVGAYDPTSPKTQLEHDFSKAQGRFAEAVEDIIGLDVDKEGDVLVLSPKKPEKHFPDIKFDKQLGRRDNEHGLDLDVNEELIIEPNLDAIRRKKPFLVTDFSKQIGRDDNKDINADEYYINVGTEEEKLENPGRKSLIGYDFGKPKLRDPEKAELAGIEILQPDVLVIDPEILPKKIKGNVKFHEGGERFPQDKDFDPMKNMRPHNTEMRIDKNKGVDATKPKAGKEISFPKAGGKRVTQRE